MLLYHNTEEKTSRGGGMIKRPLFVLCTFNKFTDFIFLRFILI